MAVFRLFCACFFGLLLGAPRADAALSAGVCGKLAQGKAYPEAARCFLRVAKAIQNVKTSAVQRKLKGLYLINASKLWQKEAARQKGPQKAYLLEQARDTLQLYLSQKLCTQQYRCREIGGLLYQLDKEINYAQLTLIPKAGTKGKVTIQGFQFQKELPFPPNLSQKLRPGKYKLVVVYAKNQSQVLEVILGPGKNKILTLAPPASRGGDRPPPPRRPKDPDPPAGASGGPPLWGWVLTIGGGVALAVGGILAGVGAAQQSAGQTKYDSLQNISQNSKVIGGQLSDMEKSHAEILRDYSDGATLANVGFLVGGVGLAAALVGIVGLVAVGTKAPKKTSALPPKRPGKGRRLGGLRF